MTYLPGLSQPAPPTMVVWSSAMTAYNFGPGHPMAPERMDLTARLAGSLGLLDLAHVSVAAPEVATEAELETVHSPEFVAAVRRVSEACTRPPRGWRAARFSQPTPSWTGQRSTP
jgi:acetoin utilization protein AcuC